LASITAFVAAAALIGSQPELAMILCKIGFGLLIAAVFLAIGLSAVIGPTLVVTTGIIGQDLLFSPICRGSSDS